MESNTAAPPKFTAEETNLNVSSHDENNEEEEEDEDEEEEEEEEEVCRICRNPSDSDNALIYPCACRGSIKFVHQNCLLHWLDRRKISHCEVCKHAFQFAPLYAPNAPARLSIKEFLIGIASKLGLLLLILLFIGYMFSVWIVIIPFITNLTLHLVFVTSLSEAKTVITSHLSMGVLFEDCWIGCLLSFVITVTIFVVTCMRVKWGGLNFGREGNGGMINRNVEFVGTWWKLHAVRFLAAIGVVEDAPRIDLGDMPFPIVAFDDNASVVLVSNMVFLLVLVFVPFSVGRISSILFWFISLDGLSRPFLANLFNEETVGSPHLSDDSSLLIGYMVIWSSILFYLGTVSMMRYGRGEPVAMLRFVIAFITEIIASLARNVFAAFRKFTAMFIRHFTTTVKVAFILGLKLGMFPLMCGWWLDVCTLKMSGGTITQRVESYLEYPLLTTALHWMVGISYMLFCFIFGNLLREVLRDGVFYFLQDIAYPNVNAFAKMVEDPVHKHICNILLRFGVHGSLIVMLVFLPVKLVMAVAPSVFPLDLSYSTFLHETFAASLADRYFVQYAVPCALRYFFPSVTITALLRKWLTVVGSALGLSTFLLPGPTEPGRRGRQRNLQQLMPAFAEASIVGIYAPRNTDAAEENTDAQADFEFVLRIILLLVLAWMTLLLFNSTMIAVPLLLGRAFFKAISVFHVIHGIKYNDLYAFTVGSCIMRGLLIGVRYAIDYVKTRGARSFLNCIWDWISIAFRSSALLVLWIFVIPVLIGILFDLMVIVPIRVPLDESPVFILFQDWALGLVLLITWTGLVMVDKLDIFVHGSWRVKFERVLNDGFSQLHALWVLWEILIPIMMNLLTALCIPYVFARGLFPLLGYPLMLNSAIHRYAWPGCLAVSIMWFCTKLLHVLVIHLHNSIRDDHYRIGQRLQNYGEDAEEKQNEIDTLGS